MAFNFTWQNKTDGEDYIMAEDVNSLAAGISETQSGLEAAAEAQPIKPAAGQKSAAGGEALPEKVTGIGSFAYGTDDNQVSGNFAYAFGRHNIISSNNSFASGSWNTVVSNYGFAVGEGNYIGAERGTALGDHCIVSQTHGQFVCGKYNSPTSGVYIIGVGENDTQRRNAVVVKENGDVAISGKVTAAAPTESNQLATKKYVDDNIPAALSQLENDAGYIAPENGVTNISSSAVYINAGSVGIKAGSYGVTIEGAPEYNSFVEIHDLAEPTADADAATKKYVDSKIGSGGSGSSALEYDYSTISAQDLFTALQSAYSSGKQVTLKNCPSNLSGSTYHVSSNGISGVPVYTVDIDGAADIYALNQIIVPAMKYETTFAIVKTGASKSAEGTYEKVSLSDEH